MDQIIDISCKAAVKFTTTYYDALDSKRHLLPKLYSSNAIFIFNGNLIDSNLIPEFHSSLPLTKHEILAFDCQAILENDLLVVISGQVAYGSKKHLFSQTILLRRESTSFLISSDCFRLI